MIVRKKLAEGKLGREEYQYIMSGKDEVALAPDASPAFKWSKLLTYRKTWAYFLGKLISDPLGLLLLFGYRPFESTIWIERNRSRIAHSLGIYHGNGGKYFWRMATQIFY